MRVVAALLTLIALPLHAGLRVDPPSGDTRTPFDVIVYGIVGGGGAPSLKGFEMSGHTIKILMKDSEGGVSAPVPWSYVAHAGVLPAGLYDVGVYYGDFRAEGTTLIVRDAALHASRHVIPISGGETQLSLDANGGDDYVWRISVDGGPWLELTGYRTFLVPPHAPGTVDVKAELGSGKVVTATALLTFADPAAPPDSALWEPILFPIAFSGPGAFGARWATRNTILAVGPDQAWFRSPLPCDGCGVSPVNASAGTLLDPGGAAGLLLWVERGGAAQLGLYSRLAESTHGSFTPVPVFRERDLSWNATAISFVPKPPPGTRTTLRVWTFGPAALPLELYLNGPFPTTLPASPQPCTPCFSTIDLTEVIPPGDGTFGVAVRAGTSVNYVARFWSLLSITDNATQQTVVFGPQR